MRYVARIDILLSKLSNVWKKHKDLGFGNLITCVYKDPALYYIEDDSLVDDTIAYLDSVEEVIDSAKRTDESIDKFIEGFSNIWKLVADLRLGQLMLDVFYQQTLESRALTEDDLLKMITKWYDFVNVELKEGK